MILFLKIKSSGSIKNLTASSTVQLKIVREEVFLGCIDNDNFYTRKSSLWMYQGASDTYRSDDEKINIYCYILLGVGYSLRMYQGASDTYRSDDEKDRYALPHTTWCR